MMGSTPPPSDCGQSAVDDSPTQEAETLREFDFHSVEQLDMIIRRELQKAKASKSIEDPTITFFDVPCHVIERDWSRDCDVRLKMFDKAEGLLVVKMLLRPHEKATAIGWQMVEKALKRSGMLHAMSINGSAKAPAVPWPTNEGAQPDASYQLRARYSGDPKFEEWPQIVIEVGSSQTELLTDVRYWFESGGPALRVVVIISVSNFEFRVTAWTIGPRQGKVCKLRDIVARRVNGEFRLTSDSLTEIRVPFATVFAREPQGEEKDFTLSARDFIDQKGQLEHVVAQQEAA